jgi:hypothetical protein
MPVSAAVWEAIWRFDPGLTPDSWATEGPQPPNGGERLNPFLEPGGFVEGEPVATLARSDAEAASLLEAAIQAERIPHWWDTAEVLHRYLAVLMDSERFLADLMYTTGLPSADDRELPAGLDSPDLPPNLLDDYEVALTRLLLIGHPPTTRQILPTLLRTQVTADGTSMLEQIRVTAFAMSRLRFGRRMTGAHTAARTALGRDLYERGTKERAPNRFASLAAVLLGTAVGTQRVRAKTKVRSLS